MPRQPARIRILIADALPMFAEALGIALSYEDDFEIIHLHPDHGPGAIDAVGRHRPDVAVIDYWLPQVEGAHVAAAIRSGSPECRVVLLSWLFSPAQIQQSIDAGVSEFIPKDARVADVADAIRRAFSGQTSGDLQALQEKVAGRALRFSEQLTRFQSLGRREVEVVVLLVKGRSTEEIAERLFISQKTVRNHIASILEKTGCRARGDLVAAALACGFIRR